MKLNLVCPENAVKKITKHCLNVILEDFSKALVLSRKHTYHKNTTNVIRETVYIWRVEGVNLHISMNKYWITVMYLNSVSLRQTILFFKFVVNIM